MGYIYKIINKVNGKLYIGQTRQKAKYRYSQHLRDSRINKDSFPIHCAIRKYGSENFKFEIIETIEKETLEEVISTLNAREIYYIESLNTLCPMGYNVKKGGVGVRSCISNVNNNTTSEFSNNLSITYFEEYSIIIALNELFRESNERNKNLKDVILENLRIIDRQLNNSDTQLSNNLKLYERFYKSLIEYIVGNSPISSVIYRDTNLLEIINKVQDDAERINTLEEKDRERDELIRSQQKMLEAMQEEINKLKTQQSK